MPDGEADPGFQGVLEYQTRRGMVTMAVLGVTGAVLFIGLHVASGSRPVWIDRGGTGEVVSLADKAFVVAMCAVLFGAARAPGVLRWGRPLVAVVMVASGLAIGLDDVARGDFSFTVAWLVLIQLVAVVTVPYSARQALVISVAMMAMYAVAIGLRPEGLAPGLHDHRFAYFILATVIIVTLAAYLYAARYGQHRALHQVDRLRGKLERRTHELERSLSDLGAAQAKLVRHERLAALGHVTAGVAHEIQNPLNFVVNFAALNRDLVGEFEEALADGDGARAEEVLEDLVRNAIAIEEHGQKAAHIVRRMMEHARGAPGELEVVDLNAFVEEHVRIAEGRLRDRDGGQSKGARVAVVCDLADDAGEVQLDRREMGTALLNLLDNAFRAALDGAHGAPEVYVQTAPSPDGVEIRVADNGAGVSAPVRDRLFEPFFTTRPPGEGTGLGLSLAYEAVTQGHRGDLTAEPRDGGGAVFVVRLPTTDGDDGPGPAR